MCSIHSKSQITTFTLRLSVFAALTCTECVEMFGKELLGCFQSLVLENDTNSEFSEPADVSTRIHHDDSKK